MSSKEQKDLSYQVNKFIEYGNGAEAIKILKQYPELLTKPLWKPWLLLAASCDCPEVVKYCVEQGQEIDANWANLGTALDWACNKGHMEIVKYLLEQGANPNLGRTIIGAINAPSNNLEIVKLLVEHGADLTKSWSWGGDETIRFSALGWANDDEHADIAHYLHSQGAVMIPERELVPLGKQPRHRSGDFTAEEREQEIVNYFVERFGAVKKLALREIVPSKPSIAIHAILPNKRQPNTILFTTGMSSQPLQTPSGEDSYRYSELVLFLAGKWPLTKAAFTDPNVSWPIKCLREIALYPHHHHTWLGGPITIIANDEPPRPYAPQVQFSAMLLCANLEDVGPIDSADGRQIQIFTLMPLHANERTLEAQKGLAALMQLFDKLHVDKFIDVHRKSVIER